MRNPCVANAQKSNLNSPSTLLLHSCAPLCRARLHHLYTFTHCAYEICLMKIHFSKTKQTLAKIDALGLKTKKPKKLTLPNQPSDLITDNLRYNLDAETHQRLHLSEYQKNMSCGKKYPALQLGFYIVTQMFMTHDLQTLTHTHNMYT